MASRFRYVFDSSHSAYRQVDTNSSQSNENSVMEGSCSEIKEVEGSDAGAFLAVVSVTLGCTKGFRCVKWLRRTDHIVQTQRGRFAKSLDLACSGKHFNSDSEWTTLVCVDAASVTCPFHGNYLVATPQPSSGTPTLISAQCSQTTKVTIGCGRHDFIQLQSHPVNADCPDAGEYSPMYFACHGKWMEDQVEYIVATDARTAAKHCFTYSTGVHGSVRLGSTRNFCPAFRNFPSDHGQFNVTGCADAYTNNERAAAISLPAAALLLALFACWRLR